MSPKVHFSEVRKTGHSKIFPLVVVVVVVVGGVAKFLIKIITIHKELKRMAVRFKFWSLTNVQIQIMSKYHFNPPQRNHSPPVLWLFPLSQCTGARKPKGLYVQHTVRVHLSVKISASFIWINIKNHVTPSNNVISYNCTKTRATNMFEHNCVIIRNGFLLKEYCWIL